MHGSCSFQVSLNRPLHGSCLRARAGPGHGPVGVMLLSLPWAPAVCGSRSGSSASPRGAPAASTAGHRVPRCVPSPVPAPNRDPSMQEKSEETLEILV